VHPAPFQIDHVIARQHGGLTEPDNLALACIHCNRFKGPNVAGVDSTSGLIVRLFHPRRDEWSKHFAWNGVLLTAQTDVGRVTIQVLNMNAPPMVELRAALSDESTAG
jgi:hypothetical protein